MGENVAPHYTYTESQKSNWLLLFATVNGRWILATWLVLICRRATENLVGTAQESPQNIWHPFILLPKVTSKQVWNLQSSLCWPGSKTCGDLLSFRFLPQSTSVIANVGDDFAHTFIFLTRGNCRNSRCYCAFIPGWLLAGTGSQQWKRTLIRSVPGSPLVQESAGSAQRRASAMGTVVPSMSLPTSCPLGIHSPGMLWDERMIQLAPSQGLLRF